MKQQTKKNKRLTREIMEKIVQTGIAMICADHVASIMAKELKKKKYKSLRDKRILP